jgi:hypothetical protein
MEQPKKKKRARSGRYAPFDRGKHRLPGSIDNTPQADVPTLEARRLFFELLPKVAPESFASLIGEIAATCEKTFQQLEKLPRPYPDTFYDRARPSQDPKYFYDSRLMVLDTWLVLQESDKRLCPALEELQQALTAWMQKFHLAENWILDEALRTVTSRVNYPNGRLDTFLQVARQPTNSSAQRFLEHAITRPMQHPRAVFTKDELTFHFEIEVADPPWLNFDEIEDYLDEKYSEAKKKFLDQLEIRCDALGFPKRSKKYSFEQHMRWFIKHQVRGLSYIDILNEEANTYEKQVHPSSVGEAVRDIAALIWDNEKTLRKVKSGRPPKRNGHPPK